MVYETETFELCHPLTDNAKESYEKILEEAATEMLFKSEHPFKWAIAKLKEKLNKEEEDK